MKLKLQTAIGDLAPSSRSFTAEGYLLCKDCKLAKANQVRPYYASEFGAIDGYQPDQMLNIFTAADDLFDKKTIKSFEGKELTIQHPPGNVLNAATWKTFAVGTVNNVRADGEYLVADILVKDQTAISDIQSQQRVELSIGYGFDLVMQNGVSADGMAYQGQFKHITGNHIALVNYGRCGGACRIGDQQPNPTINHPGEKTMKIMVDGLPFEVADNAALEAALKKQTDELAGLKAAKVTMGDKAFGSHELAAVQAIGDALTQENKALKAKVTELENNQVTPDKLDALVNSRVQVIGDAKKVFADVKTEGCTCEQIQRETLAKHAAHPVVKAILGDAAPDKADAVLVGTAFKALVASQPVVQSAPSASSTALHGLQTAVGDSVPLDLHQAKRNAWMEQ